MLPATEAVDKPVTVLATTEATEKPVTIVHTLGTTPLPGMITDHSQNASLLAAGHPQPIPDPDKSHLKGDKSEQQSPTTLDIDSLEDLSHKNCRCCRRIFRRVVLQESNPRSNLPLLALRRLPQSACAGCCTVFFFFLGVILLVSANGVKEVKVSYRYTDAMLNFDVSKDMKGPVLVWYELNSLRLNRKRIVSSKDKSIWGYPTSAYQCDNAKTLSDVTWRRNSAGFNAMLSSPGADKYRPCGLVGISMFTDSFTIYTEGGSLVELDEKDIALSTDKRLYEDNSKFKPVSGQSYDFTLDGTPSWLTKEWLERFKVWSRTPASPKVRQLYGRIRGGLPAGRYRMDFAVNDPIFEKQWKVSEKLIILSESHTLGSTGALSALGVFCIIIAVFEVLFGIVLLVAPALVEFGISPTAPAPRH